MVPLTQLPSYLPDLCLLNIFKRISLSDLLGSVRVVCTNWRRGVSTELRRRRSLVLIQGFHNELYWMRKYENPFGRYFNSFQYVRRDDGSPWARLRTLDQICFDALLLPGAVLTETVTSALMDTMPNITQLTVLQTNLCQNSIIPVLEQIVLLLNHYGNRMVSLKLEISYWRNAPNIHDDLVANCTVLFDMINQLQSLRHLTLNFLFDDSIKTVFPRLSILSRLDTLTSNYNAPWLMGSIRQYATGNIRIRYEPYLSMDEMLGLDPLLASKFTLAHVYNHLTVTHHDDMRLLGSRFSSMSRLTLFIRTMPMTMLARCLSPLTQLVHLIIEGFNVTEDELPEPDYVQVPSVRLLSLRCTPRSHLDIERLHLGQILPNLQVMSFEQRYPSCNLCRYHLSEMNGPNFDAQLLGRVEQCIRSTFRHCATLHTINLEGKFRGFFPGNMIARDKF